MPESVLTTLGVRLAAVLALVLANAFFVAAEFALVASRRTRIEAMIAAGDSRARTVRQALLSIDRTISGTQLGITLASLGLGWIGEPAIADTLATLFGTLPPPFSVIATHSVAVAVAFVLITFLHIVLGELAPKGLALIHPEQTSRWLTGPLMLFTRATNPFIWLLRISASAILRVLGARRPSERERVHSPEEILMLVEQSGRTGSIDPEDARLIEGVFEFSEKSAREVMTPRTDIVALAADATVDSAADTVARAGRSRYPVMGESLDDIVGVVHAKDVLRALRTSGTQPVSSVARPPFFVPGTREVEDVLADMKRKKVHLAVVLDEFGGTAGLVTMEDLLEEIVGQIYDEYDRSEAAPAGSGAVVPGSMPVSDVNETYGLTLDSSDYTTIGGLVFGALGRLPKVGDQVRLPGATFEIVSMEGRRVGEVRVHAGTPPAKP